VLSPAAKRKGLDRRAGLRPIGPAGKARVAACGPAGHQSLLDSYHQYNRHLLSPRTLRTIETSGKERTAMNSMKHTMSMALVLAATLGVSEASAETISGSAALALAGVVAAASPLLTSAERKAVDELFAGSSNISYRKKIAVTTDKIVCRAGNVDITARSCELTFGNRTKTINGRAANELYSTEAMAGVPSDGAAGKIFESVAKLNCTLDPQAIRQNDGSGANCTYEMPK
jgi:hypothetical protein